MSTRDLFLSCALVCVPVHMSVCLSVCLRVCTCMSMSSLLTNLSHPSDTMTLSTLCFLSPSDSLPPWREPRTHQKMLLFRWETVSFIYFSSVPESQCSHYRNVHMCMQAGTHLLHGCKDGHKTSSNEIFPSMSAASSLTYTVASGFAQIHQVQGFSCRSRRLAWLASTFSSSVYSRLFVHECVIASGEGSEGYGV